MTYRSRKTLRNFLAIALAAAFTCAGISARAQEVTGSISGTVTAAGGGVVKGANVVVTNTDHNQVIRTVATDLKGYYVAASLPVANYSVTINAPTFSNAVISGIALHANDELTVNGQLKAGSGTETVATTYPRLHVNLANATVESTITGGHARELPLGTRNFEQLLTLQPGVVYGGTVDQSNIGQSVASSQTRIAAYSIDGQRSSGNYWTIDGADNTDHGDNHALINYPSVEAIAEVTTLRNNYEASSGRTLGSQVNVITRSGTNDLHGSLYEFFRNDAMNANNYFNKVALVNRPELRYNDFGGTLGGPLSLPGHDGHDRTFFFISAEVRRVIAGASTQATEPTLLERTGNFTQDGPVCTSTNPHTGACTGVTGTSVVPTSPTANAYIQDIFSRLPAPNGNPAVGQDIHNLTYNANNIDNNVQELVRVDHKINSKATIYGHYMRDSLPTQEASGMLATSGGLPGVNTTSTNSPSTGAFVHLTYVRTPRTLFNFGYGYTAGSIHSTPIGLNAMVNSRHINPLLPFVGASVPTGIVPVLNFQGGTSIASVGNYNESSKNHNVLGSITHTWHQHTFVVGATVNHYEKTESEPNGSPLAPSGSYNFTGVNGPAGSKAIAQSFANFLQGVANNGFTQPSIAPIADLGALQEEAFMQDTWRATPHLTITAGIHYSHFLQPVDNNGRLSSFLPNTFIPGNGVAGSANGFAPYIDNTGSICTALQLSSYPASLGKNSVCPNGSVAPQALGENYDPFNGLIYSNDPTVALNNGAHESPWYDQVAHTDKLDFAPRVGFSWDMFGDGRTTLRMGYGIYYDNVGADMFENAIFNNVPFVITAQAPVASVDNPAASASPWLPPTSFGIATGVIATTSPYGYMPPTTWGTPDHFHSPYSQQYTIGVQRQLPYQILLDVAAVGSHDTHLLGREDINEVAPGLAATSSAGTILPGFSQATPTAQPAGGYTSAYQEMPLNQIRPYTGYGPINMYESSFNSNYNALQVQVQKHFHNQSYIEANYTLSHSLTNSLGDRSGSVQNSYRLSSEYGRSQFDRKNVFSLDGVYALPFFEEQQNLVGKVLGGWEVTGVMNLASGLPYTVTTSNVDPAGLGLLAIGTVAQGRPNVVGNPNIAAPNGSIHNHNQWFNTSAFQLATVCTAGAPFCLPGNEHVDAVNGPGIARVDLGLFRNFKFGERANFQFRAEAYNLLNNVNWATISTNMQSLTFGQPTSARDPRTLQLALKASF
jgi:hypothetical protein